MGRWNVERILTAPERALGDGFVVRRALPRAVQRLVGPFIFVDQMGPTELDRGTGLDVRPHPHIGLATLTYLFEGVIDHRDSLGNHQAIRPGQVNWMTAGRGIVHSERSPAVERAGGPRLHGMQMWVALPAEHEESEPTFVHHPSVPDAVSGEARVAVVAGEVDGVRGPVAGLSPTVLVDLELPAGAAVTVRAPAEELAIYVARGAVEVAGGRVAAGDLGILAAGPELTVTAIDGAARAVLVGGGRLDGERHIWWNLVSSSRERIEAAKDDWRNHRFPAVPGDEVERIPLPESVPPLR